MRRKPSQLIGASPVADLATILVGAMSVFDNSGALAVGAGWFCGGGHGS